MRLDVMVGLRTWARSAELARDLERHGLSGMYHQGRFYQLSLLPSAWMPPRHDYEDVRVDIAAVGPIMTRLAGELADGVHVHPLHSAHHLQRRLLPSIATGAAAGRGVEDVDLIIPVFAVPGDSPEERAPMPARAKAQIAFYGSTRNYAFQFEDLGFDGVSGRLNERVLRSPGDAPSGRGGCGSGPNGARLGFRRAGRLP